MSMPLGINSHEYMHPAPSAAAMQDHQSHTQQLLDATCSPPFPDPLAELYELEHMGGGHGSMGMARPQVTGVTPGSPVYYVPATHGPVARAPAAAVATWPPTPTPPHLQHLQPHAPVHSQSYPFPQLTCVRAGGGDGGGGEGLIDRRQVRLC